jgi:hypothetical protein
MMPIKFKLFRVFGALNSGPVFDAFEQGVRQLGHEVVEDNEDVVVIWSVLWQGRMMGNRRVYLNARLQNKPVVIIEVGTLNRNHTWKISVGHVNREGYFGNEENLDSLRPSKLGIALQPYDQNRRKEILIATQRQESLQWQDQPPVEDWVNDLVSKIKTVTDRPIAVRPHPRYMFKKSVPGVRVERPRHVADTYDEFDIKYDYHCVINFNSGPAVQAAIKGTPIICDVTSLAAPLSNTFENIENLNLPDREDWFLKLCHTEWTVEEIAQGIPLMRLLPYLESKTP